MEFIHQILGSDIQVSLTIILNLILIESLLSVDNAAVLATMVMDLPEHQRDRALKYGIIGAYIFRGLCLVFAAWLVNIWWLKPIGGLYLLYLAIDHFKPNEEEGDEQSVDKEGKWLYKLINSTIGQFWATVALVEVMDLAFSIDNVFAAVAFTDNIYLIWIGVFIGILAMRFVAQGFVRLMERYPFLETVAFLVIALLGLKLFVSLYAHFNTDNPIAQFLESEKADLYVSIVTVGLFLVPLITSTLFNYPKKANSV